MGNITIQGDLTGDVPGGEVGGASNLTTVGAIPYVSAAGILNQDPTALFWDAANDRLGIGTATPASPLQVSSNFSGFRGVEVTNLNANGNSYIQIFGQNSATSASFFTNAANAGIGSVSNAPFWILQNNTERARFAATTGNFLIGGTTDDGTNRLQVAGGVTALGANNIISTGSNAQNVVQFQWNDAGAYGKILTREAATFFDNTLVFKGGNVIVGSATAGNFKLDVAASGSAGTARFYGGSGVSNSTKVVVQEGGGQSGNMLEWQNSLGANLGGFSTTNYLHVAAGINIRAQIRNDNGSFVTLSTGLYQWSASGTNIVSAAPDLSLSRASAGVLQVGDGGSNANGAVSLTRSQHAGVLVAALPAAAAGNAGSIQYVTDANATTIGSTVAGGGANKVMVWSDGAAWKIFAS